MWAYDFMQHALIAGVIVASISAIISVFIVLRRMVFATHALGHMSITGFALAAILGFSGIIGQILFNLGAAAMMGVLGDKIKKNDLAIGVVLSLVLGLGAYFLFLYQNNYAGGVMSILFGNILAVSSFQLYMLGYIAIFILILLIIIARPLFFSSIDPVIATAKNVPIRIINIIFFLLVALAVSMACQIVGALLLFVLLVIPGAIAVEMGDNIYKILFISIIAANITTVLSLYAAYQWNLPVSFCLTMLLSMIYFIVKIKSYLQ
jgi:zinc/manganese transport system permease protein